MPGHLCPILPLLRLGKPEHEESTEGEEADQIKAKRGLTPKAQFHENGRDLLYDYFTEDYLRRAEWRWFLGIEPLPRTVHECHSIC